MDLTKKSNLVPSESFLISGDMHVIILDESFKVAKWKPGDAVFHGGTSLKIGYGSARGSEDLDFIVSEDEDRLGEVMDAVLRRLDKHFAATTPGAKITMDAASSFEERLDKWNIKWEHPNRRGKVLVKAEFWKAPKDLISQYGARAARVGDRTPTGLRIMTHIAIAEMKSIWADKIVAIGGRPSLKWRDAYDLAYVAGEMKRDKITPGDEENIALIGASAALYRRDLTTVLDHLNALEASGQLEDTEAFIKDIGNWFTDSDMTNLGGVDYFTTMLEQARDEVGSAVITIENYLAKGPKP